MPQLSMGLKPTELCAWVLWGSLAIFCTQLSGNDQVSGLVSGCLLASSIVYSRYRLGFGFSSGPMLYLVLFGLFHLGFVVPWAAGVYTRNMPAWFPVGGLTPALTLVDLSIVSYQIGLLMAAKPASVPSTSRPESFGWVEDVKLYRAGGVLFLAGASMFLVGLIILDPAGYYQLTYAETFRLRAEADPRLFGNGMTFSSIGLYIAAAAMPIDRLRMVAGCVAVWSALLMYLGFRGPGLIVGLVLYSIAIRKGAKIPRWLPGGALAILLLLIPVIGKARQEPLGERAWLEKLSEVHFLDALVEMGGSIRPLIETEAILGKGDYRFGKTYLAALSSIIPNLRLRWTPDSGRSLEDLRPNHWITAIANPWAYRNQGGIGFSATAEPYMNLGFVGVAGYFLFLGILLVRLERHSLLSPYALAAWALIVGPLLWTTRNDFQNFVRPAAWGLASLAAVRLLAGRRIIPAHRRVPRGLGLAYDRLVEPGAQP